MDFGDPHQVVHIHARDLTGTREAKLAELDMFLAQLQVVRLALCRQAVRLDGFGGAGAQPARNPHSLRSWSARRLRAVLNALALGAGQGKTERS